MRLRTRLRSIPAEPSPRPTAAQQKAINDMGKAHGCHTCGVKTLGTKSGNWMGDHQPSTALNTSGGPQVYKPSAYVGKNAPESLRGQTIKVPTVVRKPGETN